MNKRIEAHVNALFANASGDTHIMEIKEELLANLNEKYEDFIGSGKDETEAFALVISSIGDIDSLLKDMGKSSTYAPLEIEKNSQKRSVFISCGVALYILSIVPLIWYGRFGFHEIGLALLVLICAIASGLVAYGNSISKSKYTRANNTFVEEYKEMVSINHERSKLKGAISSSLWSLIVVLYVIISFLTYWWHITWVIFLLGACLQLIVMYYFAGPTGRKRIWHGILWVSTLIIYFIISFALYAWSWSWTIFFMAVALEQIIRLLIIMKESSRKDVQE